MKIWETYPAKINTDLQLKKGGQSARTPTKAIIIYYIYSSPAVTAANFIRKKYSWRNRSIRFGKTAKNDCYSKRTSEQTLKINLNSNHSNRPTSLNSHNKEVLKPNIKI